MTSTLEASGLQLNISTANWFTLFILTALLWVLYKCFRFVHPYWRFRNVPGPPPKWPVGNIFELLKNPGQEHRLLLKYAKQYGPTFQLWYLNRRMVIVADPEDAKFVLATRNYPKSPVFRRCFSPLGHGLLTLSAEEHPVQRKAISQRFNEEFLHSLHHHLTAELEVFISQVDALCDTERVVDLDALISALTLDVIARTAFGVSFSTQTSQQHPMPYAVLTLLDELVNNMIFYPYRFWVPQVTQKRLNEALQVIRKFCNMVIDLRLQESPEEKANRVRDLLDIFLESEETRENVIAHVATFMLAGHDTTSHTLSFCMYEVAQNRDIEKKLQEESDRWIPEQEKIIPFEQVGHLEYTRMVWNEALRTHPAAANTSVRCADRDDVLPGSGIRVTKGTGLMVSSYLIHHLPQYWEDPDRFIPERHTKEAVRQRSPYFFLPFSRGSRNCIGQFVANHEALTILSTIYKRYEIRLAVDADQVEEYFRVTMKPHCRVRIDSEGKKDPSLDAHLGLPVRIYSRKHF
jgi:cytochrome P450 family 3 subfamily A